MPHLTVDLGGRNIFRGLLSEGVEHRNALDTAQGIHLTMKAPIGALLTGEDIEAIREAPVHIRIGCVDMRSLLVRIVETDGVETIMAEDDDEIFDLSTTLVTDIIRLPEDKLSAA